MTDDDVLLEYVEESRAHLTSIESDLLTIEQAGEQADEALVNRVFRAAHSIKGGAGFFGLTKIHELAHNAEHVLSAMRAHRMTPTPECINLLLQVFDKLRELLSNTEASNSADTSQLVAALRALAIAALPPLDKPALTGQVELTSEHGERLSVETGDLHRARQEERTLVWIQLDLIVDLRSAGGSPVGVLNSLMDLGEVLACRIDHAGAGTLDEADSKRLPLTLLLASAVAAAEIPEALGLGAVRVSELPWSAVPVAATGATAAAPETPRTLTGAYPAVCLPAEEPRPPSGGAAAATERSTQAAKRSEPSGVSPAKQGAAESSESSLRVCVELLESLMNLAGELVLSRNQLMEAISSDDKRAVEISGQRINLVTSELQEAIMQTRMQPIGSVFNRFPRVVRDLSRELGKEVQITISGKDVELDKTIVEGLADPLAHMVRNAIDHGLEPKDQRLAAGKTASGQMSLNAYHEAGQVIIEIKDDGRGMDAKKIAASAVARGAVSGEQVLAMSEKEILSLIMLPGVSTAKEVTDLSGRGVGMDVVKTNLDKLGGKLEIESSLGRGTTFRVKLPLTLAIIPSLLVSVGGERFAIPQVNVDELIRITAAQVKKRIEVVGTAEVLVLRGKLIPIIHLADYLQVKRAYSDATSGESRPDRRQKLADRRSPRRDAAAAAPRAEPTRRRPDEPAPEERDREDRRYRAESDLNIVVVTGGACQYGLVVEELHDTVEIVVKPLGRHLKQLREYAGVTIMGDGRVALILDVAGLAARLGLTSVLGSARAQEAAAEAQREKGEDVHSFLLFHNAAHESCVVPLGLVSRVEQVQTSQIELLGGRRTMQYRGATLPLVTLRDAANVGELTPGEERVVIVFEIGEREVGLLASKPVDAVDTTAAIEQSTLRQRGIMGSAIIRGQTTLVVDVFELVETVLPEWAGERPRPVLAEGTSPLVLLAEDSAFFRAQVQRFLESDGWRVLPAVDGQAAWELLQQRGEEVKLVVTDIEMPRMTGLELARSIHGDPRFGELPVIALSSLAGEDDISRGQAAGVNDYQIKLDKEKLLASVRRFISDSVAV